MGKTLYLECYSGISGDMTVGALLDLGAREEALREALEALPLNGYEITIGRTKKCGIDACDFDVILEEEAHDHAHDEAHVHEHDHEAEHCHDGEGHVHEHIHGEESHEHQEHFHDGEAHEHYHEHLHEDSAEHSEHCHSAEGGHPHDHEHSHGEPDHSHESPHSEHNHTHAPELHDHSHEDGTHTHDHPHTHGPEAYDHHHDHVHRHYADIMHMLDEAPLKPEVRALAKKIFRIVGEAESRVHACPLEEVHFHETGAVDSIVDIVGAAACAVDLGITETYVSTIYEGQGHVWCQHGRIPVPAPAVAGIAAAEELDLAITNVSGEMVTPTGAAIAAAFRTKKGLPKTFVIRKIGMGAGKKDFPHANLLRAMIIEPAMNALPAGNAVEEPTRSVNADGDSQKNGSSAKEKSSSDETEDEIWVLETNLDDCTGEMMGLTMELLLAAGARDVNYTPIYMKKNRPACKLEVLCKEEKVSALEEVIFHQTTAIGLRKRKEVRRILPRKKETVMTPYGEVELKICTSAGETYIYPEYDSIRGLVQETGRSYQEIYQKAVEEAWKKRKND